MLREGCRALGHPLAVGDGEFLFWSAPAAGGKSTLLRFSPASPNPLRQVFIVTGT
jgi:hypothetical protein